MASLNRSRIPKFFYSKRNVIYLRSIERIRIRSSQPGMPLTATTPRLPGPHASLIGRIVTRTTGQFEKSWELPTTNQTLFGKSWNIPRIQEDPRSRNPKLFAGLSSSPPHEAASLGPHPCSAGHTSPASRSIFLWSKKQIEICISRSSTLLHQNHSLESYLSPLSSFLLLNISVYLSCTATKGPQKRAHSRITTCRAVIATSWKAASVSELKSAQIGFTQSLGDRSFWIFFLPIGWPA